MAAVVIAGLASRRYPHHLPGLLDKEAGDALWATAASLALRLFRPRWPTPAVAAVSLAAAFSVEFSQAYPQPALGRFRAHGIGHLILGSGFGWIDHCAYVVRVAIAWLVDVGWVGRAVDRQA